MNLNSLPEEDESEGENDVHSYHNSYYNSRQSLNPAPNLPPETNTPQQMQQASYSKPVPPPPPSLDVRQKFAPPPPPPPGPVAPPSRTTQAKLLWSPKDLNVARKKLRRPNEILKQVDVERSDVFDKFENYKYMPLVDSREYLRTLRAEIVSISLEGVEQVTDAFLFSLHHCQLKLDSLNWVSLSGCYHVTDDGVYWLTKAFKNMKSVELVGCHQVREKGLHHLLSFNENIKNLDLRGTGVSRLPPNLPDHVKVNVVGCPLISPPSKHFHSKALNKGDLPLVDQKIHKLVILNDETVCWSPLAVLTNDTGNKVKEGLTYKSDWSPLEDSSESFNVFEISADELHGGLLELVVSDGSLVVLPYHMFGTQDVDTIASRLTARMTQIITRFSESVFLLLGLSADGMEQDQKETMLQAVREKFTKWDCSLKTFLRNSIKFNWSMAALDFHDQQVFAAGENLLAHSSGILKAESEKMKNNSSQQVQKLMSAQLRVGDKLKASHLRFLQDMIESSRSYFPWIKQPLHGNQVHKAASSLEKMKLPLQSLTEMVSSGLPADVQSGFIDRNPYNHIAKVLTVMGIWGKALYYPILEEKAVITDVEFLCGVIKKMFFCDAPRHVTIRCLGPSIPCLTFSDIQKICSSGGEQSTAALLIKLLTKYGCLIRFPCDPWTRGVTDSSVFVLSSSLPNDPPQPLEKCWPADVPAKTVQRDRYFTFVPGLPLSFFSNLLRYCVKFGSPLMMWKTGCVIQKGPVNVLVELLKDSDEIPIIVVSARLDNGTSQQSNMSMLGTTLKLYTSIVDYLVHKYNLYAAKTLPCTVCHPSYNRHKILRESETRHSELEHLIRSGLKRGGQNCKACKSPVSRSQNISADCRLSSLVPFHDVTGLDRPTRNNFNRCLLCENCAVRGVDCVVNLTKGISSWHCLCNRQGKLCDFCGMCQGCFMTLMRMLTTMSPGFEKPRFERGGQARLAQLAALDTVLVTTKGSMMGFTEDNTSHTLEQNMTPNYFPRFQITFMSEPFMEIQLKLSDTLLLFNTQTGFVVQGKDTKISTKDIERRVCREGDTLTIILEYTEDGFSKMNVAMEMNSFRVFSFVTEAQEMVVTMTANRMMHMQMACPGRRSMEDLQNVKPKRCGFITGTLSCGMEMSMYDLLENVEDMVFGGRGLSLTGVANVILPSNLTREMLQYPAYNIVSTEEVSHHFLCLTWNPKSGKKNPRLFKHWIDRDAAHSSVGGGVTHQNNFEVWTLSRLLHFLDAEGVPARDLKTDDSRVAFLLWSFHFILTTYPKMLLPSTTDRLLPGGLCTSDNQECVEAGLRDLLRVGFWKYYLKSDISSLTSIFSKTKQTKASYHLIVTYCSAQLEEMLKKIEATGLQGTASKFNTKHTLYLCGAHANVMSAKQDLEGIPSQLSGIYGKFLSFIDLSYNKLRVIPDGFFQAAPNLCDLVLSSNDLEVIPASITYCRNLYSLSLTENNLTDLPAELAKLEGMVALEIGSNCMTAIPAVVMKMTSLVYLSATHMQLRELPDDIGNLKNLRRLFLIGNCLTSLPRSFRNLTNLEELGLSGIPWVKLGAGKMLSSQSFKYHLQGKRISRWLLAHKQALEKVTAEFGEQERESLDNKNIGPLNALFFNMFPRFGYKGIEPPDESLPSGFPEEILSCTNLKIVYLGWQAFTTLPADICKLEKLEHLYIGSNPNLLSIPAELAKIKTLHKLELDDCPLLKTPPKEIRDKGFGSTFAYLRRLLGGALPCKRTKLMLVGLGGAGKTSLVRALLSSDNKANLTGAEDITDGIEIKTWNIKRGDEQITYNVWDFAGQTVYYNTHQFFLSNRAVYLLLWNVRLGHEHAGLDFWLSSISVQAPNAPIFVVGSHIDQVDKFELPSSELQQKYPQISGFFFISSLTGKGIQDLQESLFQVTLQQEYMGEHIPAVWLTFEKNIASERQKHDVIEYKRIEQIANTSGIFDSSEIFQAVQFLHDLGSLQHFNNDFLKSKVVINPQWIVNVMACVVSVKQTVIKEGRLHHHDISELWKDYPKHLHFWLLRLTEEYDLTFPLAKAPINLVPCLMSEKKPEYTWPALEKGSDMRENKMIYKFDYLPAGLFNRGQVRLQDISDGSVIWKTGSFLRKNGHIALLQKTRAAELMVAVQGPRPENILFMVHEVFEGLIMESFQGVTYDYLMPCPECSRLIVKDPHMFAASTIRRAIDLQAPFLQCVQYFHTISCVDLVTLLPPDSHSDFDLHLVHMVQGLKDLRKDLCTDVFLSYSTKDTEVDNKSGISPLKVMADLKDQGFRCWSPNTGVTSTDEMAKALIDSSIFLAFVSTDYAETVDCVSIFKYARLTLRKPILVVAVGSNFDWKQSKLGILLTDEVFVNMTSAKVDHYDSKLEELVKALQGRTNITVDISTAPTCFISYSWVNSATAVERGTRSVPGALGYGDPRKLKEYLEKHGVNCWIDVERVGMNGLFDDIAEGLLNAKVVVVCVSDEYASSSTCQIEFRYAANTLKLPIIMAVVGTGDQWRATEVGLLSVYYPIVNFQEHTKTAKKKLLQLVREKLADSDEIDGTASVKAAKQKANEEHKNMSFQELFELAQRKLLRQLSMYAENQDTAIYPRLFLVDFARDEGTSSSDETDTTSTFSREDADAEIPAKEEIETLEKEKSVVEKQIPDRRKLLKKQVSSIVHPLYKLQKFSVHILCEHEQGWHSCSEPLPLPDDFGLTLLSDFSPYLARMTAVMKYNKRMVMMCQEDEIGQSYIKWLEESPEAARSDYQDVYHKIRDMVIQTDTLKLQGKLARCHLPNGKTIWLCDKHRQDMRLTVLSSDDKSVNFIKDTDSQANSALVTALRSMTRESFSMMLGLFTDSVKLKRRSNPVKHKGDKKVVEKKRKTKGKLSRRHTKDLTKAAKELNKDEDKDEDKQDSGDEKDNAITELFSESEDDSVDGNVAVKKPLMKKGSVNKTKQNSGEMMAGKKMPINLSKFEAEDAFDVVVSTPRKHKEAGKPTTVLQTSEDNKSSPPVKGSIITSEYPTLQGLKKAPKYAKKKSSAEAVHMSSAKKLSVDTSTERTETEPSSSKVATETPPDWSAVSFDGKQPSLGRSAQKQQGAPQQTSGSTKAKSKACVIS